MVKWWFEDGTIDHDIICVQLTRTPIWTSKIVIWNCHIVILVSNLSCSDHLIQLMGKTKSLKCSNLDIWRCCLIHANLLTQYIYRQLHSSVRYYSLSMNQLWTVNREQALKSEWNVFYGAPKKHSWAMVLKSLSSFTINNFMRLSLICVEFGSPFCYYNSIIAFCMLSKVTQISCNVTKLNATKFVKCTLRRNSRVHLLFRD